MPKPKKNIKNIPGFSLVEMLVYLSIFVILISSVITMAFWLSNTGLKIKLNYELADNARRAIETMTYEIKNSYSLYAPTSVFNSDNGQLSLEQIATSTSEEILTYADFFKCGDYLCLKKEGQAASAVTGGKTKISRLYFQKLSNSENRPSIQITIKLETANPVKQEEINSLELTSTALLRAY